jgi:hypothetical protein
MAGGKEVSTGHKKSSSEFLLDYVVRPPFLNNYTYSSFASVDNVPILCFEVWVPSGVN